MMSKFSHILLALFAIVALSGSAIAAQSVVGADYDDTYCGGQKTTTEKPADDTTQG